MLLIVFAVFCCLQVLEALPLKEEELKQLKQDDAFASETGFANAVAGGSKYFQYAHVPEKDHYEHGHKRGNEHHFIERHEKAHPHSGEFKTKVRWGDKHGGYGEHYWDYNHDGHDHDGEQSQQEPLYVKYEEPDQQQQQRYKRNQLVPEDVEFLGEAGRRSASIGGRHGGNYRWHPQGERNRRQYFF